MGILTGDLPGAPTTSGSTGISDDGLFISGVGRTPLNRRAFRWSQATNTIVDLGALPGGNGDSRAKGISGNGAVVAGFSSSGNISPPAPGEPVRSEAFRWEVTGGCDPQGAGNPCMVGLGDLPGGIFSSGAQAISTDGTVVVGAGNFNDVTDEAFRWTAATGMVGLGGLVSGSLARMGSGSGHRLLEQSTLVHEDLGIHSIINRRA